MAYITKQDLTVNIRTYRINQIIDGDDTIIENASMEAEAMIIDALTGKYDTTNIFNKTGAGRDKNILSWAKYIVLYKIYERIPDENVPERVIKNYDDTFDFLMKIAEGRVSVSLPRIVDQKGEKKTKTRWGSVPKRTH